MFKVLGFAGFVAAFFAVMFALGEFAPAPSAAKDAPAERTLNVAKATPAEKAAIARYKAQSDSQRTEIARLTQQRKETEKAIAKDLSRACGSKSVFEKIKVAGNRSYWRLKLEGVGTVNLRTFVGRQEVNAIYAELDRMMLRGYGTTIDAGALFYRMGHCSEYLSK